MNKLTQRDRFLLIFISVVAALFLVINYGYRPLLSEIFDNQDTIAELEEDEKASQMKVDMLPATEEAVETTKERLTAAGSRYFPWMESYQIERMLTVDALEHGLETRDQIIRMPELTKFVAMKPYFASSLNALATDATQTTLQRPECEVLGLFVATDHFYVRGDAADLQGFLDRLLCEQPSIQVTGFEWSKVEYPLAGYSVDALNIEMNIFMLAPEDMVIQLPTPAVEETTDSKKTETSGGAKREELMDAYE